jgi:hypothetical protein
MGWVAHCSSSFNSTSFFDDYGHHRNAALSGKKNAVVVAFPHSTIFSVCFGTL